MSDININLRQIIFTLEHIGMGLEYVGIQTTHVVHQRITMNSCVATTKVPDNAL